MSLNLYDILKEVINESKFKRPLNESVSQNEIMDAIKEKYQVWINYSDEKNRAPGRRLIEPYVLGISKAGNPIVRAFLWKGNSFRGAPRYETLRLDRITSWKPLKNHKFVTDPRALGLNVPEYNKNGDKSMLSVICQAKFDNNDNTYQPSLDRIRNRTNAMRNLGKVTTRKTNTDLYGDLPFNQRKKTVDTYKSKFNDMVKRNLDTNRNERPNMDDIWADYDRAEAELQNNNNQNNVNDQLNNKNLKNNVYGR